MYLLGFWLHSGFGPAWFLAWHLHGLVIPCAPHSLLVLDHLCSVLSLLSSYFACFLGVMVKNWCLGRQVSWSYFVHIHTLYQIKKTIILENQPCQFLLTWVVPGKEWGVVEENTKMLDFCFSSLLAWILPGFLLAFLLDFKLPNNSFFIFMDYFFVSEFLLHQHLLLNLDFHHNFCLLKVLDKKLIKCQCISVLLLKFKLLQKAIILTRMTT